MGVVTRITLDVLPGRQLHRRTWCAHIDWTLHHFAELQHSNRNMDFYWYPRSDETQIRTINEQDRVPEAASRFASRRGEYGEPREVQVGPTHRTIPRHRSRRIRHVRVNDLIDPEAIELDRPYGCVLRSPVPVVVQFLRQDTRLPGVLALASTIVYSE